MMPIAPTAQCSRAPPVNILYMPSTEFPVPACFSKKSASTPPFKPGTRTTAAKRQTARTSRVKRIRDFSSGILKQFRKVSAMAAIMGQNPKSEIRPPPSKALRRSGNPKEIRMRKFKMLAEVSKPNQGLGFRGFGFFRWRGRFARFGFFRSDDFARTALGLDLGTGGSAERMCADGQLAGEFAVTEDFYAAGRPI